LVSHSPARGPRPVAKTVFPGLRTITTPLNVTQSEGNLVSKLDGANTTAQLISAIKKRSQAAQPETTGST